MSQPAFDFGDEPVDDPANPTYTVAELADALNASLRRGFSDGVWVRGEIQGWSERGQHAYFTLADDSAGSEGGAQRAVLRQRPDEVAADAAEAPPPTRRRDEGARVRLPRLLRPRRPARAEDGRPRPALHARRSRRPTRRDHPPPGRRRPARRQQAHRRVADPAPRRRRRAASTPRRGTTSTTSSCAAASGSTCASCDVRVQGPTAARADQPRRSSRSRRAATSMRSSSSVAAGRATSSPRSMPSRSPERSPPRRVPVFTGLGHEVDRSVADEVAHTAFKTPTACAAALVDAVRAVPGRRASDPGARSARCPTVSSAAPPSSSPVAPIGSPAAPTMRSSGPTSGSRSRVETVRTRAPRALAVAAGRASTTSPPALVRRPHQLLAAEDRHLASVAGAAGAARPGQPAGPRLVDHPNGRRPCRSQCEWSAARCTSSTPRLADGTDDEPSRRSRT